MKSSSATISTSESSVLMCTGRPNATATDRSRVNNVHQIRFHKRLSGRLSCDPSTLPSRERAASCQTLAGPPGLPAMHARALSDNGCHSSPVKDVFSDVWKCVSKEISGRSGMHEINLPGLPNTNPSKRVLALWSLGHLHSSHRTELSPACRMS